MNIDCHYQERIMRMSGVLLSLPNPQLCFNNNYYCLQYYITLHQYCNRQTHHHLTPSIPNGNHLHDDPDEPLLFLGRGVPQHQLQCSLRTHPVLLHIGEGKLIQVLVDLSNRKADQVVKVVVVVGEKEEEEEEDEEEIKNTMSAHTTITS